MATQGKRNSRLLICTLLAGALIACSLFQASEKEKEPALTATLSEMSGKVLSRPDGSGDFAQAALNLMLKVKDQLKTLADGRARLDLSDNSIVRLGPNTIFTLEGMKSGSDGWVEQVKVEAGKIWVILSGGTLEVETPSGLAGVRGSYLSVLVKGARVRVTCLEGACSLENQVARVELTAGQAAEMVDATTKPKVGAMNETDVQDWLENNPEATRVVTLVNRQSSTATRTPRATAPPIQTTAIGTGNTEDGPAFIRRFFSMIDQGDILGSINLLDTRLIPDNTAMQTWGATFNTFDSVQVTSIELVRADDTPVYKVGINIHKKTNVTVENSGWEEGSNTRWITLSGNMVLGWRIQELATGP